jgi:hypothetical protein
VAKLIILSIVIVSFAVPMWFASSPHPRRALGRVQMIFFICVFVWALMCLRWYPQLVPFE